MAYLSEDVNVYVESKSFINEFKPPQVLKAAGLFKKPNVANKLARVDYHTITESSIKDEYNEALSIFEDELVLVYNILSAKGGITQDEWNLIKSSVTKGSYIFPECNLRLGTITGWKIDEKAAESFLTNVLKKHGISLNITSFTLGEPLYNEGGDAEFIKEISDSLGIKDDIFSNLEKIAEDTDYAKTKARLHYLTLYDFIELHLGLDSKSKPSVSDLVNSLSTCHDKTAAGIIDIKRIINEFPASLDFWDEYDKYREYKNIQVFIRWIGRSQIRALNSETYQYLSDRVRESLLSSVLRKLRIHTAVLGKKTSADTSGSCASYKFRIENAFGDIYALVNENTYASDFSASQNKVKLTSPDSLELKDLEYGKTYCVSLWESFSEKDAVKLGDLPGITPGIKWPEIDNFRKSVGDRSVSFSFEVNGGDSGISYIACLGEGHLTFSKYTDGKNLSPEISGNVIKFSEGSLEYEKEYTLCVFAVNDKKFSSKIISEFYYIPEKVKLIPMAFRAGSQNGDSVYLDFMSRGWPESVEEDDTIIFACRKDRFPSDTNDGQIELSIPAVSQKSYLDGSMKISFNKSSDKQSTYLYLCGWLGSSGGTKLVIQTRICNYFWKYRKKVITFFSYNEAKIDSTDIPHMRIYAFNKKRDLVYSNENAEADSNLQFKIECSDKIHFISVEAADANDRLTCQFKNETTKMAGEATVKEGLFG